VVDNASSDASVKMIKADFPHVKLICNQKREGFSRNHNKILKNTESHYKLILNEDTIILNEAIKKLVVFLRENSNVGAVGPQLLFADKTLQRSVFDFPTINSEISIATSERPIVVKKNFAGPVKADWINGSCILFSAEALSRAGYLDEDFFIFYEDVDICKRLHEYGFDVYCCPQSRVVHYCGKSKKGNLAPVLLLAYYKSRERYFLKHKGFMQFLILKIAVLIIDLLKLLRWVPCSILCEEAGNRQLIKSKIIYSTIGIKAFFTKQKSIA